MRKKTSTPRTLQRQVRIQLVLTNNDQVRTSNLEASLPWSGAKNSSAVAHRTMTIANPTAACFQREWSSTRPSRLTPERWKRELIEKVGIRPKKGTSGRGYPGIRSGDLGGRRPAGRLTEAPNGAKRMAALRQN